MMSVVNTVKTYVSQQNFVSYIRYKLSSILILFFHYNFKCLSYFIIKK